MIVVEVYDPTSAAERLAAYRDDLIRRIVAQVEWQQRHPDINPHDPAQYGDELHAVDPYPSTSDMVGTTRFLDIICVALDAWQEASRG